MASDIVFHYGQRELLARLVAFERDPTARWLLVFVPRCWGKSITLAEYAANCTTRSVLFVDTTTSGAELAVRGTHDRLVASNTRVVQSNLCEIVLAAREGETPRRVSAVGQDAFNLGSVTSGLCARPRGRRLTLLEELCWSVQPVDVPLTLIFDGPAAFAHVPTRPEFTDAPAMAQLFAKQTHAVKTVILFLGKRAADVPHRADCPLELEWRFEGTPCVEPDLAPGTESDAEHAWMYEAPKSRVAEAAAAPGAD